MEIKRSFIILILVVIDNFIDKNFKLDKKLIRWYMIYLENMYCEIEVENLKFYVGVPDVPS